MPCSQPNSVRDLRPAFVPRHKEFSVLREERVSQKRVSLIDYLHFNIAMCPSHYQVELLQPVYLIISRLYKLEM